MMKRPGKKAGPPKPMGNGQMAGIGIMLGCMGLLVLLHSSAANRASNAIRYHQASMQELEEPANVVAGGLIEATVGAIDAGGDLATESDVSADVAASDAQEADAEASDVGNADAAVEAQGEPDICDVSNHRRNAELWGSVVREGQGQGAPAVGSASECCEACRAQRGCNVWVYCDQAGCAGQCWLKRDGHPDPSKTHANGPNVPWTSGAFPGRYEDVDVATLPAVDESISAVGLSVEGVGVIRINLRPEWSQESVEYIRRVAANGLCSTSCEFYRAEPGFLLQGSMEAYIPANTVTKEGPRLMQRGDVGWAGGSAGPHFFIYLGAQPATHFGLSHTVFGEVDEESLKVVETLVALPAKAPQPGGMHMIEDKPAFELAVV